MRERLEMVRRQHKMEVQKLVTVMGHSERLQDQTPYMPV